MDFISSFLRPSIEIELLLDGDENRDEILVPPDQTPLPLYLDDEPVTGKVLVMCFEMTEYIHFEAELSGHMALEYGEGKVFFSSSQDLAQGSCPGELPPGPTTFELSFDEGVPGQESYYGAHVQIEYTLTVLFETPWQKHEAKKTIFVKKYGKEPASSPFQFTLTGNHNSICAHLEAPRDCYHTKDVIEGKVTFEKCDFPIQFMEILLVQAEKSSAIIKQTAVTPIQIMEGTPSTGDAIPFRIFLEPFQLLPSCKLDDFCVECLMRLKVYSNGLTYQKQGTIQLWRKKE